MINVIIILLKVVIKWDKKFNNNDILHWPYSNISKKRENNHIWKIYIKVRIKWRINFVEWEIDY